MIAQKTIEETRVSPETVVAAGSKKASAAPRKRTAKPKEIDSSASSAPRATKKHRAAKPAVVAAAPALAMAAAAGSGSISISSEISVASATAISIPTSMATSMAAPSQESIAELAYSYWLARGCQDGKDHEDWLRAEEELRSRSI